jgi:ABC-2 type transport system permease protein
MMGMFGFIFQDSTTALSDVQVGVVIHDQGVYGEQVVDMFKEITTNLDSIQLVDVSTETQAKDKILSGEIKAALIIPQTFSNALQTQTQTNLMLIADPSNPTVSQSITQVFNGLIEAVSNQFSQQLLAAGMPYSDPDFLLHPISITVENVVSGGGSYFDFVAPGFIALNVMTSGLTALGAALARERETGTLEGVLMSPIARISIILGKTVSNSIRNLLQASITITIAVLIFGISIRGNLLLIASILIIGTISFLGIGIVATSIAKEQESAQLVLGLLQFPMMFLSGVLFPVEQMPAFLQMISKVLPLTYAVEALRKVMILGAGIEAVIFPLIILIIIGAVTMAIGVPLFNRAVKR